MLGRYGHEQHIYRLHRQLNKKYYNYVETAVIGIYYELYHQVIFNEVSPNDDRFEFTRGTG
jgi:hypothetical protein